MVDSSDSKEALGPPNENSLAIEDGEVSQDHFEGRSTNADVSGSSNQIVLRVRNLNEMMGDRTQSEHDAATIASPPGSGSELIDEDSANEQTENDHGGSSRESPDKESPEYCIVDEVIVLSDSDSSDYQNDLICVASSSGELERRRIPTLIDVIDLTEDSPGPRKRKRSLDADDPQPKKMKFRRSSCSF